MGSFIFLGPTGVGKTHSRKQLAKFMFGDPRTPSSRSTCPSTWRTSTRVEASSVRLRDTSATRKAGQLTEKVRRKPYSVVLLDEIEKAHPDIFNMLLQIMEEGRLTDSFGRQIDFKNVILIMTSNIGEHPDPQQQAGLGFDYGRSRRGELAREGRTKDMV